MGHSLQPCRPLTEGNGNCMTSYDEQIDTKTISSYPRSPKRSFSERKGHPPCCSKHTLKHQECAESSASVPDTSVSTPSDLSSQPPEPSFRSPPSSILRFEKHRNTKCVSKLPVSEFRRNQHSVNWNLFTQRLEIIPPHLQLIDDGGSANVYATFFETDEGWDTLAIKILRRQQSKYGDVSIESQEPKIMSSVQHNHIVAYVGSFHPNGQVALLMYPVATCNLADRLHIASDMNCSRSEVDLRLSRTFLKALGCLSSAIKYLHVTLNIKHKDIKPENILVTKHDSVLLADFGISKQYEAGAKSNTEGKTQFTDKYAPSEVVNGKNRDLSADIWSLGCVFLEILTVAVGESLGNLSGAIFNKSHQSSYRNSQSSVVGWLNQLKLVEAQHTKSGFFDRMSGDYLLTAQHFDAIQSMLSEDPEKRPSILKIYETFKGFASHCDECQSNNNDHQVTSTQTSGKLEVLPRILKDPIQAAIVSSEWLGAKLRDNYHWDSAKVDYVESRHEDVMSRSNNQIELPTDINEDENISELDYMSSDSEMADDPEFSQADPESYVEEVAFQCLSQNRELRFANPDNPEVLQRIRSCVENFLSNKRRQGSPLEGPPSKRRSDTNRKRSSIPGGQDNDNNDEEDGEENPNERLVRVSGMGSTSKSYACPYRKYNRVRTSENSRCKAGWPTIPRLKGHLFRRHQIYPCVRCRETFSKEEELTTHLRMEPSCKVVEPSPDDAYDWGRGFNNEQGTKLKSRDRNVPETRKWRKIYKILFPLVANEDIPSPFNTSQEYLPPSPSLDSPGAAPFNDDTLEHSAVRLMQRFMRHDQQQQYNSGGYISHASAHGEPGFRQLPTPQNTLTNPGSGQMPYTDPFQMNQLAPSNSYFNTNSQYFSTISALTNDSTYDTSHSSTHQPAYGQYEYRQQEQPAAQSLGDRPVLTDMEFFPGMENYELGNNYQFPPGSMA